MCQKDESIDANGDNSKKNVKKRVWWRGLRKRWMMLRTRFRRVELSGIFVAALPPFACSGPSGVAVQWMLTCKHICIGFGLFRSVDHTASASFVAVTAIASQEKRPMSEQRAVMLGKIEQNHHSHRLYWHRKRLKEGNVKSRKSDGSRTPWVLRKLGKVLRAVRL